jgi:ribosomal protein L21E
MSYFEHEAGRPLFPVLQILDQINTSHIQTLQILKKSPNKHTNITMVSTNVRKNQDGNYMHIVLDTAQSKWQS